MHRVGQHGRDAWFREVATSWKRALALLLCVSFIAAGFHSAAADVSPMRDGPGVSASLGEPTDPCGETADGAPAHCCACHHGVATVSFAPLIATPTGRPLRFVALPSVAPAWPTNPPPKPPRT